METVYITTHLVMALCIISVFHLSNEVDETILDQNQNKIPVTNRLYTRGLKLIEVTAKTAYRIAASILISYLK